MTAARPRESLLGLPARTGQLCTAPRAAMARIEARGGGLRDALWLVLWSVVAFRLPDLVRVLLSNRKTVDGAVQHTQGGRISEFFNAAPDFFAVEDTGGVVYVNKRHVISINI